MNGIGKPVVATILAAALCGCEEQSTPSERVFEHPPQSTAQVERLDLPKDTLTPAINSRLHEDREALNMVIDDLKNRIGKTTKTSSNPREMQNAK